MDKGRLGPHPFYLTVDSGDSGISLSYTGSEAFTANFTKSIKLSSGVWEMALVHLACKLVVQNFCQAEADCTVMYMTFQGNYGTFVLPSGVVATPEQAAQLFNQSVLQALSTLLLMIYNATKKRFTVTVKKVNVTMLSGYLAALYSFEKGQFYPRALLTQATSFDVPLPLNLTDGCDVFKLLPISFPLKYTVVNHRP